MSHTSFQLRYGPWAVVTGASDGIGLACAQWLAQQGLHLVLVARREDRLNTLAAELTRQHAVQVRVVATDLAQARGNQALMKAVEYLDVGLLVEWRRSGVDVLASAPGPVHTGFAQRAGMQMGQAATPEVVAHETLSSLGQRGTVRPGWLSKLLGWSLATAPRALRVQIMAQVMRGMTAQEGRS